MKTHINEVVYFLIILSGIILISLSCVRSNKLKTDEASLRDKILLEEKKNDSLNEEQTNLEKESSNSVGIAFVEEVRREDPNQPMKRIDLIKSRDNYRKINLSEISDKLEYIHLSNPGDTSFVGSMSELDFSPNLIYVKGFLGVACFDMRGNFVKKICESSDDHMNYNQNNQIVGGDLRSEALKSFYGCMGDILTIGDKVIYLYKDYQKGISQLMMFDPVKDRNVVPINRNAIENESAEPIGRVLRSFSMKYRGTNLYPLDDQSYGTIPDKIGKNTKESLFISKSFEGDTLCVFKDYDPIKNFSNSAYRGVDGGDTHYINGEFHYRPRFNDTLFRLKMPNRLIPKYYFDFGDRGISSSLEAMSPSYSLKDKFIHRNIIESDKHLFIEYTQDYTCPATAKKGTLKYNRAIYFKKTGELIHFMKDAVPYMPPGEMSWPTAPGDGIINDIDSGLDFWPHGITESGVPYMSFSGFNLRNMIIEKGCNSMELIEISNRMKDNEIVLILVK